MRNRIGTRPRRTVTCAGLLFGLVLGGCSAGAGRTAHVSADSGAAADADGTVDTSAAAVEPTTTTTMAVATTTPPTTARATTTTARPAATTTTTAKPKPPPTTVATTTTPTAAPAPAASSSSSSGQCHASYQGTCIPPDVSDADCAGGSGNGPWYVQEKDIRVVGTDVFDLDRDGDGIGCES